MKRTILFCAVALLAGGAAPAAADIFHLTDGRTIEGVLVDRGADDVTLKVGDGEMTLPADRIERIESAPAPETQYAERLKSLGDTAEGHVALARWCESKNLLTKARRHYLEALELEANNVAARSALGYTRRDGEWVHRGAIRQATERRAGEGSPAHYRERFAELRDGPLSQWHLSDAAQQARAQITRIDDPAAIEPLLDTFGEAGDANMRMMVIDTLANIGNRRAVDAMVAYLARDPHPDVAGKARRLLPDMDHELVADAATDMLEKTGTEGRRRLAPTLADVGAVRALPSLIDQLTGTEKIRVHHAPTSRRRAGIMSGTVRTYIRKLEPVVAAGAVGYRPVVGVVGSGGMLDVDAIVQPWTETITRTFRRPDILAALRRLTGRDFGYDKTAWRRWYNTEWKPKQQGGG